MSLTEQILTIAIAVLAVQFTRWLPFWIFPANRPIPEYIHYFPFYRCRHHAVYVAGATGFRDIKTFFEITALFLT